MADVSKLIDTLKNIGHFLYEKIPDNFLGEKNTIGSGIKPVKREEYKSLNDEQTAREFWKRTTNL